MMQAANALPRGFSGDVLPAEAWAALEADANAQLIDVRTHAEWMFSGMADLSSLRKQAHTVSWKFYPNFERNPQFVAQLEQAVPDHSVPLYFLCKTGGRSTDAAIAAADAGYVHCYNIAGGFEGDFNSANQRGRVNGWKAANLPWCQA